VLPIRSIAYGESASVSAIVIAVFGTPVTTTGQLVSSARQRAAAAKR